MISAQIRMIVLIMAFLPLITACSNNGKDENTLIVGTSFDNPPYEYTQDGQNQGFDVDLMDALGRKLGKKIKFKNFAFQDLIAALIDHQVDIVAAGISATKDRMARVNFSIPYYNTDIAILFRKQDQYHSPSNLKNHTVGVQLGTTWAMIAHHMSATYHFSVTTLANNTVLVDRLQQKKIDAIILEGAQVKEFIRLYPDLSSFKVPEYSLPLALALPQDSEYLSQVNKALQQLQDDGTIDGLKLKWNLPK